MVWQRCQSCLKGEDRADPLKVFVKQEPHSAKKLAEGRYRLISAVSLVDSMVDRIVFAHIKDNMDLTVGKTPIRVGWSIQHGGWREMAQRFTPDKVLCLDKSCWDWSVQAWVVEAIQRLVIDFSTGLPDEVIEIINCRFKQLFETAVFGFIDGTRVKQQGKGIMKSGCYMTICFNSIAQLLMHAVTSIQMGIDPDDAIPECLGDDTIQDSVEDLDMYSAVMSRLGCTLKTPVTGKVEFAGFQFSRLRVIPAYYRKHLFKLAYNDNLSEYLEQMQYLYVYSPVMYKIFQKAARETQSPIVSVSRALRVMG